MKISIDGKAHAKDTCILDGEGNNISRHVYDMVIHCGRDTNFIPLATLKVYPKIWELRDVVAKVGVDKDFIEVCLRAVMNDLPREARRPFLVALTDAMFAIEPEAESTTISRGPATIPSKYIITRDLLADQNPKKGSKR